MPATGTTAFQREFAEPVRALRAIDTPAPDSLRARVRGLGEPAPRRELPRVPWRRAVLVLAPVCVLALLSAAVVHGVLSSGEPARQTAVNWEADHGVAGGGGAGGAGPAPPAPSPRRRPDNPGA